MKSLTTIKIYRYAIEAFGDTRESGTTGRSEMVVSGSGWTGGCVDAKRDGWRAELTHGNHARIRQQCCLGLANPFVLISKG